MLSKKEKVKVEFNITINQLSNLPKDSIGNEVFVEAKRGSKAENHSSTKKVSSKDSTVKWDEKLKFSCSLVLNPKTKKYEPKKSLTFDVKEEKDKKGKKETKSIGKVVINLSDYAEPGTSKRESLPLSKDKNEIKVPTLVIKIESQLLNQKASKKEEGAASPAKDPNNSVTDTPDLTEPSVDSISDNEEKSEFPEDDNEKEKEKLKSRSSVSVNEKKNDKEEKNEVKEVKEEQKEEKPMEDDEDDGATVEDLKIDKSRLKKKLDRLTSDLEVQKKKVQELDEKNKKLEEETKKKKDSKPLSAEEASSLEDLQLDNARYQKK